MATLEQIEAARRNGAKRPRSLNGVTHGIYARCVVLESENSDAWVGSVDECVAAWKPADSREYRLVTDIANANWRIDRLSAFEVAALDLEVDRMHAQVEEEFEKIDDIARTTIAFTSLVLSTKTLHALQTALRTQYRIRDRAVTLLLRLQKERKAETAGHPAGASNCPTAAAVPVHSYAPLRLLGRDRDEQLTPEPAGVTDDTQNRGNEPDGSPVDIARAEPATSVGPCAPDASRPASAAPTSITDEADTENHRNEPVGSPGHFHCAEPATSAASHSALGVSEPAPADLTSETDKAHTQNRGNKPSGSPVDIARAEPAPSAGRLAPEPGASAGAAAESARIAGETETENRRNEPANSAPVEAAEADRDRGEPPATAHGTAEPAAAESTS